MENVAVKKVGAAACRATRRALYARNETWSLRGTGIRVSGVSHLIRIWFVQTHNRRDAIKTWSASNHKVITTRQ